MNVFHQHIAPNCRGTLCFVINNGHIYPIFNSDIKKDIAKRGNIKLQEIVWEVDSERYVKVEKHNTTLSPLDNGIDNTNSNDSYQELIRGDMKNSQSVALIECGIEDVISEVVSKTGYLVTALNIKNSEIMSFQHPVNHQIVQYAPQYALDITSAIHYLTCTNMSVLSGKTKVQTK